MGIDKEINEIDGDIAFYAEEGKVLVSEKKQHQVLVAEFLKRKMETYLPEELDEDGHPLTEIERAKSKNIQFLISVATRRQSLIHQFEEEKQNLDLELTNISEQIALCQARKSSETGLKEERGRLD